MYCSGFLSVGYIVTDARRAVHHELSCAVCNTLYTLTFIFSECSHQLHTQCYIAACLCGRLLTTQTDVTATVAVVAAAAAAPVAAKLSKKERLQAARNKKAATATAAGTTAAETAAQIARSITGTYC
jgi:hypothetical protein